MANSKPSERIEVQRDHDFAHRLAVKDLIEMHPVEYGMYKAARLKERRDKRGYVDRRFRANRQPDQSIDG